MFSEDTIAEVYRHSRGLPRLINTLCENALVTAYVRRMPSVTPDVIGDVAKEFRLGVVCPPEADRSESYKEMDVQRAITVLLDMYAALQRPIDTNLGLDVPETTEAKQS